MTGKNLHENTKESYEEEKSSGHLESNRHRIYTLLSTVPGGLTDRMIMEYLLEEDFNNIRPEITRLKEDGILHELGKTKCPKTGKSVRMVALTGAPYFARHNRVKSVKSLADQPETKRDLFR